MNASQLTLALVCPVSKSMPVIDDIIWLDVSDIARGVGFETMTAISIALADSLAPISNETETHYDQRLYDALWLAQLQFTMNDTQPTTFNFSFPPMQTKDEVSLRLYVESINQTIFIGLLQDFEQPGNNYFQTKGTISCPTNLNTN